jgi:hypothetical protein
MRRGSIVLEGCLGKPNEDENLCWVRHSLGELLDLNREAAKEHNKCGESLRSIMADQHRTVGGGGQQLSIPLGSDTIITPAARLFFWASVAKTGHRKRRSGTLIRIVQDQEQAGLGRERRGCTNPNTTQAVGKFGRGSSLEESVPQSSAESLSESESNPRRDGRRVCSRKRAVVRSKIRVSTK